MQAQLDGAPLPAAPAAAALDEAHLLPMIEDELDADTHSWLPSLRQVCCARAAHASCRDARGSRVLSMSGVCSASYVSQLATY
jgi:hypothetical protein